MAFCSSFYVRQRAQPPEPLRGRQARNTSRPNARADRLDKDRSDTCRLHCQGPTLVIVGDAPDFDPGVLILGEVNQGIVDRLISVMIRLPGDAAVDSETAAPQAPDPR